MACPVGPLTYLVLMLSVGSNQAQQDFPLSANVSVAEAEAAANAARHWMQMQNAERSGGPGCSRDKCVEACDNSWEQNGDHCYFWGTNKKNWTDAEDFCQEEGGHLASVTTNETKDFVLEGMNRRGLKTTWIGGNDIEEEGVWKWTDCTQWGFTFWSPTEPNSGHGERDQDCLRHGNTGSSRMWDDGTCSYEDGFLCSRKICTASSIASFGPHRLLVLSNVFAVLSFLNF